METCYDYLACHQTKCVMYGKAKGRLCWQVEGTLSNHHGIEIARRLCGKDKEAACARVSCLYYRATKTKVVQR